MDGIEVDLSKRFSHWPTEHLNKKVFRKKNKSEKLDGRNWMASALQGYYGLATDQLNRKVLYKNEK